MVNYTEKWKKGELEKAKYWVKYRNGNIDIWELSEGIPIESKPEIIEVLAPVPSFEQWQSLNELLDSMRDTNKALAHRLNICKELLIECREYVVNTPVYPQGDDNKQAEIHRIVDKINKALK